MIKPILGYDKSHFDDPKETQDKSQFFSLKRAWAIVCRDLITRGYQVRPEIGGQICGHTVYIKDHNIRIRGIETPNKFWYWRQLKLDTELWAFLDTLQDICEKHIEAADKNRHKIKCFTTIMSCVMDSAADPKSAVAKLAHMYYHTFAREGCKRPATLNGASGYYKVVPQLSWFPERLQQLDARKLLTLYPDAEARQMMLLLGRAVVGANGTTAAEGVIEHTFRSYGVTIGQEPGLGKSSFHQYIISAMELLGYKISLVHINDTRFGWGEVAQADLAFIDDLTDDVQKRLLSDARIKSIVSNNLLMVEQKNQPAHGVRATSVLLGCSNLYNPAHYIGMDAGSTSRVNQLDTYSSEELKKKWKDIPDARTKPYWEQLAKEYEVSVECLAAYLLRRSADYFLETCGYRWLGNKLIKDQPDRLEETVKANRAEFRLDTGLRHVEELITATTHATAVAIAKADEHDRQHYLSLLAYLDFSPALLTAVLRMFSSVRASDLPPEEYKKLYLWTASWDCKKFISSKLNNMERLNETMSAEQAFSFIIKELKSNKGFGYPLKPAHYVPLWLSLKRQIPDLVEHYKQVLKSRPAPQSIRIAAIEIQKIFNEM